MQAGSLPTNDHGPQLGVSNHLVEKWYQVAITGNCGSLYHIFLTYFKQVVNWLSSQAPEELETRQKMKLPPKGHGWVGWSPRKTMYCLIAAAWGQNTKVGLSRLLKCGLKE